MQLPKKQKNISSSFCCISEIYIQFSSLFEKGDIHSSCLSKITDCERRG